ncbi:MULTISPECIES: hypothetical protein [Mycobacteriaceae]|uniref:Uncharacterized protein n=1 Tax=Mycolicibacterium senegalense TaxID=1796 RepID=A0ABR5FMD5_9MYCO|nr:MULTISPECIES: hypothetical protein [Mycolicibacterium]KLI09295.1 hypothetical protein AA982_04375 [Mycolicibacterium senegalense]KLO47687.1 hypothetical protein ABW05_31395 [Mycolicibacterium senegalense]OMB85329.1 hypothetical protein A5741_18760 [Mycolicibacterium conceptionense]
MKWIEATQTVELTQRNVTALADKLDDRLSCRTLVTDCRRIAVCSIEDSDCTVRDKAAAASTGIVRLTRSDLAALASPGAAVAAAGVTVVAVQDKDHYGDRAPGTVYMPSTEEYR